ncbi:MAG: DUF3152 domain-containing protein [Corynebacterium sp.]|nr:DUF3152 domain-containing protein [Corynebacterium sp.]
MDSSRPIGNDQHDHGAQVHDERTKPSRWWENSANPITRFGREYGWWRVIAIPVLIVLTAWVIHDIVSQSGADGSREPSTARTSQHRVQESEQHQGPDPAEVNAAVADITESLPPGGSFTEAGNGTFREVGTPGQEVGSGEEITIRYTVKIEDGVDTTVYGGDDAFATMVDSTLADPRGWTHDSRFKFIHVAADDAPDTTIQLTSLATAAKLCGAQLHMETSCHTRGSGDSQVVINESRWVRGATAFEGDLGNYRQYLINHEFGHDIGYADHQACSGPGRLAPVMMQQTLSLNNAELFAMNPEEIYPDEDVTCEPNPWPYPLPSSADPHLPDAHEQKHSGN